MNDSVSRRGAPIARGGPRFLVVFGSMLLLLWGVIALAAGTASASGRLGRRG